MTERPDLLFNPEVVGKRIRGWRAMKGLSVKELAEAVGSNSAAISRIERGVLPTVHLNTMLRLAQYFGVTLERLLSDEPDIGRRPAGMAQLSRYPIPVGQASW